MAAAKKEKAAIKTQQIIVECTVVEMAGKKKGDKTKMELSTARACKENGAVTFTEPK